MAQDDPIERLQRALGKIEARIRTAEARPSREEIEALRDARQNDLKEIKDLQEKIQAAIDGRA